MRCWKVRVFSSFGGVSVLFGGRWLRVVVEAGYRLSLQERGRLNVAEPGTIWTPSTIHVGLQGRIGREYDGTHLFSSLENM